MKELDSKVVRVDGHYERQTYLAGDREDLGQVVDGLTGTETFVRRVVIKPVVIFTVRDEPDYEQQAVMGDVPPIERRMNGKK